MVFDPNYRMVGYFMGCCQWYDSYESVDRIFLKDYLVSARELSSLVGKLFPLGQYLVTYTEL